MSTSTTTEVRGSPVIKVSVEEQGAMRTAEQDAQFQATARGNRNGTLKLRGIPTFSDQLEQRKWMKGHMAAAFRFFGKQGYNEGISGHISMRGWFWELKSACTGAFADGLTDEQFALDPVLKDHFWMNPYAKHFSSMRASDLVLVDNEGYVVEGGNQAPINEAGFMIHSEIHKARPDVIAAAHTHGIYGKTWSVFGRPIEMLSQGE